MDNQKKSKRFWDIVRVISMILNVVFIVSIIGFVINILGLILINIIPKTTIQGMVYSKDFFASITFGGLSFAIKNTHISATEIIKNMNILLFSSAIKILFSIFCIKQLQKIINSVKMGTPFTNDCVKSINTLGKLIIISSILIPIVSNIFELYQFRMFNINKILISSNFISNIHYTFNLFDGSIFIFGIIILILGKVFEYGCYLQDEYDSVL